MTRHAQRIFTAALAFAASSGIASAAPQAKRLKRADAFLGIHLDFHAGEKDVGIGAKTTPAMIENLINIVQPDWIQIDNKGHAGVSSYPTKVGFPAPGLVVDALPIWREVTARRGVSLYMHHSGVADDKANAAHPDWAAIMQDGKPHKRATSLFGPYADLRLIPQLKELAVYGIDGVWVDGECWASSSQDYSPACVAAFQKATGIKEAPRKPEDPNWHAFRQFQREAFRKYLRHYITEVKKKYPHFEICSNWAFSDHMPEPVSAPVDFLSGDFSPENSVNSARVSGRYLAQQGKTWDLMAWGFATKPVHGVIKTAVQMQREAAMVVALGGGIQVYYKQNRDGSVNEKPLPVMGEVAKFCRERQQLCHHSVAVPQVGLLFSTAANYRKISGLFNRDYANLSGTLEALLESQLSVEVLGEHHLTGKMSRYPVIVVPEWDYLQPEFKEELVSYVKNGGNLVLVGPKSAALFEAELGVTLDGSIRPSIPLYLANAGRMVLTKGASQNVKPGPQATAFGTLHETSDIASPSQPAASITALGKGKIAAVYFNLGTAYQKEPSPQARGFLNDLTRQLFPEPMVGITGSSDVEVCLARNHAKLLVNLINTSGPHRTEPIIESITPVGPLEVDVRIEKKPAKVTLEPGARELPFGFADGKVSLTVPQVRIHEIIAITP